MPDLFFGLVFGFPCLVVLILFFFGLLALNGVPVGVALIIAVVVVVLVVAAPGR
jgi:hypothetical protein